MFWCVFLFMTGMLTGMIFTIIVHRCKAVGSIKVAFEYADDKPYLFLELSKDVNTVLKKKYIVLKIDPECIKSQE